MESCQSQGHEKIHTTKEFRYNYKQRKEQRGMRDVKGEKEKNMADRVTFSHSCDDPNRNKGHLHARRKIYIGH